METRKVIKYDIIANYLYNKYLNNVFNPYEKINIDSTLIYCEVVEIFKYFENHKKRSKIIRYETEYERSLYEATKFNFSWVFDKMEKEITSKTITLDNIKRLLAFIIYPENLLMVFNLKSEFENFTIYKFDLCKSFIKLNFLNTTSKEYKILLTYITKLENELALNSGSIDIALIKENEVLKEKNKMLVNLIINSTTINNSNSEQIKTSQTLEFYKAENEKLKKLLKAVTVINKRYVETLNKEVDEKIEIKK